MLSYSQVDLLSKTQAAFESMSAAKSRSSDSDPQSPSKYTPSPGKRRLSLGKYDPSPTKIKHKLHQPSKQSPPSSPSPTDRANPAEPLATEINAELLKWIDTVTKWTSQDLSSHEQALADATKFMKTATSAVLSPEAKCEISRLTDSLSDALKDCGELQRSILDGKELVANLRGCLAYGITDLVEPLADAVAARIGIKKAVTSSEEENAESPKKKKSAFGMSSGSDSGEASSHSTPRASQSSSSSSGSDQGDDGNDDQVQHGKNNIHFDIKDYWTGRASSSEIRFIKKCFDETFTRPMRGVAKVKNLSYDAFRRFFWIPTKHPNDPAKWPPMIQELDANLPPPQTFNMHKIAKDRECDEFRKLYKELRSLKSLATSWELTHHILFDSKTCRGISEYTAERQKRYSHLRTCWKKYSHAIEPLARKGKLPYTTIVDPSLPWPPQNRFHWVLKDRKHLTAQLAEVDCDARRIWFLNDLNEHPFYKEDKKRAHATSEEDSPRSTHHSHKKRKHSY